MYKKGLDHISVFLQTLKFKALYGMQKAAKENGKRLLQYNCASQFHSYIRSCVLNLLKNAWFLCTLMCIQYINMWLRLSTLQRKLPVLDFFWSCRERLGLAFEEWVWSERIGFGIWEKNPRACANEGRSSAASTILSWIRAKSIKKKKQTFSVSPYLFSGLSLFALWLYDAIN